jgi:hypothetical protein
LRTFEVEKFNFKLTEEKMKNNQLIKSLALALLCTSLVWLSSCEDKSDEGGGGGLANEVSLSSTSELSFLETDTTVTVTYDFTIPARSAGTATISAAVVELAHGVNYTTTPAESTGVFTIDFAAGAASFSFDIVVIDDDQDLASNGNVTFTLTEVAGEDATIGSASVKLTIIDNEGGSITLDSEDAVLLGEVVPGTETEAKEITFTSVNILADFEATTTDGFTVSATADGTFESTATISAAATSIFVKAAPSAVAALGGLDGTVTFGSGDAKVSVDLKAVVSGAIGVLFWVEDFDYPVDDTYPSYGENGGQSYVPCSAYLRHSAVYNGTNSEFTGLTGLTREGHLDTWYTQIRMRGIPMGDNPLTFANYPGSGVGRTVHIAKDGSQTTQNNNNCDNYESKNVAIGRRFVPDGQEITEGTVYMSTMIKVNEVFEEVEGGVLKNAIIMLTGDFGFVNNNAMKLNVAHDGGAGFLFGVSKSKDDGSVVYSEESFNIGETYAVVMKVEIKPDLEGENPNDVISLFVFKDGDEIPSFETAELTPVVELNETNQDLSDVSDVTTGLETIFMREVADDFAARPVGTKVQNVEMSGIRIATSWYSLFQDKAMAMYDSQSEDELQTSKYGNDRCGGLGNIDK